MCGLVSLFGFAENRLRTNKRRCTRHMIVGLSYETAILSRESTEHYERVVC